MKQQFFVTLSLATVHDPVAFASGKNGPKMLKNVFEFRILNNKY